MAKVEGGSYRGILYNLSLHCCHSACVSSSGDDVHQVAPAVYSGHSVAPPAYSGHSVALTESVITL